MKTIEVIDTKKQINLDLNLSFSHVSSGHGHWKINLQVYFYALPNFKLRKGKDFKITTSDSMFVDEISDMKANDASSEDLSQRYFDHFFSNFEPEIMDWLRKVYMNELIKFDVNIDLESFFMNGISFDELINQNVKKYVPNYSDSEALNMVKLRLESSKEAFKTAATDAEKAEIIENAANMVSEFTSLEFIQLIEDENI